MEWVLAVITPVRKSLQQEQQQWSARLREDLRLKRLQLPSLPEVTRRLREAVADRSLSIRGLAQILSSEPVLAAKLMQAASGAWTGLEPSATLEQAITRLGQHSVRGIVYNYCLSRLFQERQSGPLREELRKVWLRATLTAAYAELLNVKLAAHESYALLAGMMHNIGELPVLALFSTQRELAGRLDLLKLLLQSEKAALGEAILKQWQMPDEICAVPMGLTSPGDGNSPQAIDIVRVALELARWQESPNATVPAIDNLPAAQRLGLNRQRLEPWLVQSRAALQGFTQLLQH